MKYEVGKRYNLKVSGGTQEVTLIRMSGGLFTVKFDTGGAIRVHGSRLSEIPADLNQPIENRWNNRTASVR